MACLSCERALTPLQFPVSFTEEFADKKGPVVAFVQSVHGKKELSFQFEVPKDTILYIPVGFPGVALA